MSKIDAIMALADNYADEASTADRSREPSHERERVEREKLRKAIEALAQPAWDEISYKEAVSLATALFKKHFAHEEHYASGLVVWGPCDTTAGVISQIDNMVCRLVHPQPAQEAMPVAQIVYAGDMCGTVEWLVHNGRPISVGQNLYTATQKSHPLTDEQITGIWAACSDVDCDEISIFNLARAIEAVHNIKGVTE